jgi:hypothetical protein
MRGKRAAVMNMTDLELVREDLPTSFQYFTGNGIVSGLKADNRDWFELNGKQFRIFSGSLHYFRVHPTYWRDRLRKFRAAGLNTIDV